VCGVADCSTGLGAVGATDGLLVASASEWVSMTQGWSASAEVGGVGVAHRWEWLNPRCWGIVVRSAMVSAVMVLVAMTLVGAGLAVLLYRQLLADVDDAAARRVRDVAAALRFDSAPELDAALLATDQRIVVVQIVDPSGAVVRSSAQAPPTPVVDVGGIGPAGGMGMAPTGNGDNDVRVSAQTVTGVGGRYTVLVGAGSEGVESTVKTVLVLLAGAAPIVVVGAGGASYGLVRRSLRSVDAIRARVADISAHDLCERVPVPAHRDEISALALTMNAMLARIHAGQDTQRRFVADASHELRSPLATVISALAVGVAHPELLGAELANDTLLPEARRMQSLVEDLLLLARADERGLALRRDDVDLDDLAAREVARIRRETSLDIHADVTPARLTGDRDALARVLRNVVDNAARHAHSRIEVGVGADDDTVVVTVADDGAGIAADERVRVFDRFVRLDTDRSRAGGGSGLGLAIVAEIVAAHHGRVVAGERDGGGTVIRIQLPGGVQSSR
jgi:signal transduction histidine kinase